MSSPPEVMPELFGRTFGGVVVSVASMGTVVSVEMLLVVSSALGTVVSLTSDGPANASAHAPHKSMKTKKYPRTFVIKKLSSRCLCRNAGLVIQFRYATTTCVG